MNKKRGQVWVETVTYTLIGLTIIGLLIAGINPKIKELEDKNTIKQVKNSLEELNTQIEDIKFSPGNQRKFIANVERGKFIIDPENDQIIWQLTSDYKYSEPNIEISEGNLKITTKTGTPWNIEIKLPLNIDLKYEEQEIEKEFREASATYSFIVKNNGESINIDNID
jgi:hypothetical protein